MSMVAVQEKPARPVLRYHGGKWDLAPWIISHFPPHTVYCEPFGGAGSVLMLKPPSMSEVYNDLDSGVVELFRVLRSPKDSEELQRRLIFTPYAREEFDAAYEPTDEPIEAARRLIIRSRMGFNSGAFQRTGFRANNHFAHKPIQRVWSEYPIEIQAFAARLHSVVIEHRPAIEVIKQHDTPQTLHYVDPPYAHSSRGATRYKYEMDDEQHVRLAAILESAEGMVVLSGYRSPLYETLYAGWRMSEKVAKTDGGYRTEILWLNEAAKVALDQTKQQTDLFVN